MTPLEQLLLGLTLFWLGVTLAMWLGWRREQIAHEKTKDSRDMLRGILRDRGLEPPREHPLADHLLAANLGLSKRRSVRRVS